MSFNSEVKEELCKIDNKKECCMKAEGYGLLLFSKMLVPSEKSVKYENRSVARTIAEYAASCAGVIADVRTSLRKDARETHVLVIRGEQQKETLCARFGHSVKDANIRINKDNIKNECCKGAFLRGAFIASGSIADPMKEYLMEFIVPYARLAEDLFSFITDLEFAPICSITKRNGINVIYIKDGNSVENLLTFMSARTSSMNIMQTRMYKEAKNNINRLSNFETANIDRTLSASAVQTAAIAMLSDSGMLKELSPQLRQIADLRLENPEMTLGEMSRITGISRSGVKHRMDRLIRLSGEAGR
jgi:DNA-binding protein WhiA